MVESDFCDLTSSRNFDPMSQIFVAQSAREIPVMSKNGARR